MMSMLRRTPLALLALTLAGCPEPNGGTAAQDGAPEGGEAAPFNNPNDARFSVAPGEGVKLSGTFNYAGTDKGSYRLDFLKQEGTAPPMLVHTLELPQPGEWSLEVPKGFGPLHIVAFVDLKGDGPTPDDPAGKLASPVVIGQEPVGDVNIDVTVGGAAGGLVPGAPPEGVPPSGAPAEGANSGGAPADGAAPAAPPADDPAAPAGGTTPPTGETTPPAGGTTPPAGAASSGG